ncbi:hypothetical protein D9M72_322200 [compost metagenome]
MATGLGADGCEGFHLRAVLLHVREAGPAEQAKGAWNLDLAQRFFQHGVEVLERAGAVFEGLGQRTGRHEFEAEGQCHVDHAALHRLAREEQGAGAGRAIVVDVEDGDARHADLVERLLPTGRGSVDIAGIGLLHLLVADAGIGQCLAHSLRGHHVVVRRRAGLHEGNHADAGDIHVLAHGRFLCLFACALGGGGAVVDDDEGGARIH